MAGRTRPSIVKREREFAKRQRQARKAAKAALKRERRNEARAPTTPALATPPIVADGTVPIQKTVGAS